MIKGVLKKIRGLQDGFTLIEILITIALMGIFIAGFFSALTSGIKASTSINNAQHAKNLTEILAQQIIQLPYNSSVEGETATYGDTLINDLIPASYASKNFTANITLSYPHSPDLNLQKIMVTVYYAGRSLRILDFYKVNQ